MKRIKKAVQIIMLVLCLSASFGGAGSRVVAAPEGYSKYMDEDIYDYYLDTEEAGLLNQVDALFNKLANLFFKLIELIGRMIVSVYQNCAQYNFIHILSDKIDLIQSRLYTSLFEPLLWAALGLMGIRIIGKIWRRNLTAAIGDIVSVMIVMAAAVFVVQKSGYILGQLQFLTNSISEKVIADISYTFVEESEGQGYETAAAGVLWKNMVHTPWMLMEFGEYPGGIRAVNEQTVEEIMRLSAGKKRQQYIQNLVEQDENFARTFSFGVGISRIPWCFCYIFLVLTKSIIIIALAVSQFIFQVLSFVFLLIAPIVLALAIFPGFDFGIVAAWLKKILGFQIATIVVAMILAVFIYLDNVILLNSANNFETLSAFEGFLFVGILFGSKKIAKLLETVQRGVQNPQTLTARMRNVETKGSQRAGRITNGVKKFVKYKIYKGVIKDGLKDHSGAGKSGKGKKTIQRPNTGDNKNAAKEKTAGTKQDRRRTERQKEQDKKWEEKRKSVPRPNTQEKQKKTGARKRPVDVDYAIYTEENVPDAGDPGKAEKHWVLQEQSAGKQQQGHVQESKDNPKPRNPAADVVSRSGGKIDAAEQISGKNVSQNQDLKSETSRSRSKAAESRNKARKEKDRGRVLNGSSVVTVEEKERKEVERPTVTADRADKIEN